MLRRSVNALGRFRSTKQQGYVINAVTGTNCVTFGIDASKANTKNLIGFAVSRQPTKGKKKESEKFLNSHKAFPKDPSIIDTICCSAHSTFDLSTLHHPIQSFMVDDHKAMAGTEYTYRFYPMTDDPSDDKLMLEQGKPISLTVKTETSFDAKAKHQVFFNNASVAGQKFAKKFPHITAITDEATPEMNEAVEWLARDLNKAVITFIRSAKKGDTIRGLFYEFRKKDLLLEFKAAAARGVKVVLVLDMCPATASPRIETLETLKELKMPYIKSLLGTKPASPKTLPAKATIGNCTVIARTLRPIPKRKQGTHLQHNKVMILERKGKPVEVWTGSTNLTTSGLAGQCNVGHWVRDATLAKQYRAYWDIIAQDLDLIKTSAEVAKLVPAAPLTLDSIKPGITAVFSPRPPEAVTKAKSSASQTSTVSKWEKGPGNYDKDTLLHLYFRLLAQAKTCGVMTLPFGTPRPLVDMLTKKATSPYMAIMLNKDLVSEAVAAGKQKPSAQSKANLEYYNRLQKIDNLDQAHGAHVDFAVSAYVIEEDSKKLGLSEFVPYVHSKFCVSDPLTKTPVVVTGSANFSDASTYGNDENMIIIKGDTRVADIYFTEFRRIHSHYRLRDNMDKIQTLTGKWAKATGREGKTYYRLIIDDDAFQKKLFEHAKIGTSAILRPDDSWVKGKYGKPGKGGKTTLAAKRVAVVNKMQI